MSHHFSQLQGILRCMAIFLLLLLVKGYSTAQLSITESHAPVNSLSVGDLDFKVAGSNNWFFTLNINYPGTHSVVLTSDIEVNLADGTPIENPAATLETYPFNVTDTKSISNLDIGKTDIKTKSFEFKSASKDKLQTLALGTGKLPAGTYKFHITVTDKDNSSETASTDVVFTIQNVSRCDLITPQDGSNVPTYFPFFQWIYDGTDVQVAVYEKTADMQSNEDALSGTPMFTAKTGDPYLPAGSQVLQYPSAGARPLLDGHSYVWQVKGLTAGSGGSGAVVNSEIWGFTINSVGNKTIYNNTTDTSGGNVTSILTLLPGLSQDLISQLLAGSYSLTGVITLDGITLTAQQVRDILDMLAANPDKVIDVSLVQ